MKLSLDLYKYIFYLQIMFSISLKEKIWQEQVQVLEVFPPQAVFHPEDIRFLQFL